MAKPRLIILIRHGQSEGNKNREIHQTVPDHRVKLTPDGIRQAHEAGRRLRNLLRPDDTIHFFTSPYRRTRETTEGILQTLTSDESGPSPFRRSNITVHEEPRLREQDFGNFQPCSAEMERMWLERADYGHFFYRIPNGESAADAYDRVSGFNESLYRQFGEDDFASVCVLVTHGLMSRVFLMKWYHFSVEYFEDLRNINHCEFLIMRKEDNGKYLLESTLRTWSELRRERALKGSTSASSKDSDKLRQATEGASHTVAAATTASSKSKAISEPPVRQWGGCPNGCSHTSHYKNRTTSESTSADQTRESSQLSFQSPNHELTPHSGSARTSSARPVRHQRTMSSDADDDEGDSDAPLATPDIHVTRTLDEPTSQSCSPFPTGHRIRNKSHLGRDFGGTYSGHASAANSDAEHSEHSSDESPGHHLSSASRSVKHNVQYIREARRSPDHHTHHDDDESQARGPLATAISHSHTVSSASNSSAINAMCAGSGSVDADGARRRASRPFVNRLGDHISDGEVEPDLAAQDSIDGQEAHDRSIIGSVY